MEVNVLEYQVLSIIRDRLNYLKYAHLLKPELFESKQTKKLLGLIKDYHVRYGKDTLTVRALRILLNSSIKDDEKNLYRGAIRRIRRNIVADEGLVDELVKKFVKRQILKSAIIEAIDALDSGEELDLERVKDKINEAIVVDSKNIDDSYDYFKDPLIRISDESVEQRVQTGICSELDSYMGGGLGPGELGFVLAPTGVGKTLMLINIGVGAMLQGVKVVHATLEISPRKTARRYDVRTTKKSFDEIREDPGVVTSRLVKLRKTGAGLHIKDYTASTVSVLDFRAYLERLKAKGFGFGLIIVDYADLMYHPGRYKDKRHELTSISQGLRRIAAEFEVPLWTASQAGRKAGEAGRTSLWDISEDIGKANTADIIIAISQNELEKEEGFAKLKIVKTRLDKHNPTIPVTIDYDTMTMKGVRRGPSEVRRELRGKHQRNS